MRAKRYMKGSKMIDVQSLWSSYQETHSVHRTAKLFCINANKVCKILKTHGYVLNNARWTFEDDARLKKLYGDFSITLENIGERLGRSKNSISVRVSKLKLNGRKYAERTDATKRKMQAAQIELCRHPGHRLKMSQRAKDWHRTHDHPNGFAGKKHSEQTKLIIGQKSKAFNAAVTSEQRKEFSAKAVALKIKKYGTAAPVIRSQKQYSRCKGGRREDLGMYFRSAWEANYARYLNFLVEKNVIQSWQYEPQTFRFPVMRGCTEYTPDFKVTEKDGRVIWHEIKGWMDQKSKTKLKRFNKYYPEEKLILIDEKSYRAIAKTTKDLVSGWE